MPGQTGRKGITVAMLSAALRKHAGVPALVAQELGCDRTNVTQRVARSPKLQALVAELDATIGDVAVGVIYNTHLDAAPSNGTERKRMARWYADRKLRHLGFVTHTELGGPDGSPLPIGGGPDVHVHVTYVTPPSPGAQTEEDVV